jgi:hypothetical protein
MFNIEENKECKICNKKIYTKMGLSRHLKKDHNIDLKQYYDLFFLKKDENICKMTNCNNKTEFDTVNFEYKKCCKNCNNTKTTVKE